MNIQEEDDDNGYLETELGKQLKDENFSASSKFLIVLLLLNLRLFGKLCMFFILFSYSCFEIHLFLSTVLCFTFVCKVCFNCNKF